LVKVSGQLAETGPACLETLRDATAFFDANEWGAARAGLLDALDIASGAIDRRLQYSIDPIAYDVEGVDPQSLSDLIEATRDDRFNLFAEYWQRDLYPALEREA